MTAETIPAGVLDECWRDLVEKTDRTSPEDYPEMALITREELGAYLALADRSTRPAEPAPEVEMGEEVIGYVWPDELNHLTADVQPRATLHRATAWPNSVALVRLSTLEAERARADAAVRMAVEDERDRLMQMATDDTSHPVGSAHAVHWLHRNGAMLPADRARLRADQPAGEGGEA